MSARAKRAAWREGRASYQVFSYIAVLRVGPRGEVRREEARVPPDKTKGLALLQPGYVRGVVYQDPFRALGLLAAGTYDRQFSPGQRRALRRQLLRECRGECRGEPS